MISFSVLFVANSREKTEASRAEVRIVVVWRYIPASGGGHPASLLAWALLLNLELEYTLMPALRKLRSDLRTVDMAGYMTMASESLETPWICAAVHDKSRAADWVVLDWD